MAFLDVTQWLDIQDTNATNEARFSELGIVDAVAESTQFVDYISPSAIAQMAELSSNRNVQIPVIKEGTVVVNMTPGFANIPSNLLESDQYTFAAVDVFTGFRHYPGQYANNAIDENFAREQKMKNVAYAAGNEIENLLTTQLEARKTQLWDFTTQVSQGTLGGTFTFNAGTDTLELNKAAQQQTMFANMSELFSANELGGQLRYVTNRAGLAVQKTEALQFGDANSRNIQALGMVPADRMHESGNISAGADIFNGFAIRDGAIGMYENFPYDFRNGTQLANQSWSISPVEIPFCRMRANIYVNNEATDATALVTPAPDSNLIMTTFSEMAMWFRFFIVYRYNSDLTTRANDIVKIQGLTV